MLGENLYEAETEDEEINLKIMLYKMQGQGVKFFIDDCSARPEEIFEKALCEDSPYMADYVFDNSGRIEQVRFDKVLQY